MAGEASSSNKALEKALQTGNYVYLVVMLIGVVVQLVLCLYALWSFLQKPWRSGGKRARLLCVSFAIWTFYSAAALIDSWNIIGTCSGAEDTYPLWSLGMSTGMTMAYMVIGDCLMLWRCWAICNGPRWKALAPLALLLTSITFGILSIIQSVTGNFSHVFSILWVAFSVCTNILITSFIVSKLLLARREVIKSEMYDHVPRFYHDMIVILVESAAPLAIAGLCAVVVSAVRLAGVKTAPGSVGGLYLFDLVSHVLFLFFAAMSPQMILFRTLVVTPRGLRISDCHDQGPGISQSVQFSTIHHVT